MNLPYIDMKATGANFKRLCDERGVTVRYLQEEVLGLGTVQAIYKWRHGRCLPTIDNLVIIAAVLDVKIEDILVIRNREIKNAV